MVGVDPPLHGRGLSSTLLYCRMTDELDPPWQYLSEDSRRALFFWGMAMHPQKFSNDFLRLVFRHCNVSEENLGVDDRYVY